MSLHRHEILFGETLITQPHMGPYLAGVDVITGEPGTTYQIPEGSLAALAEEKGAPPVKPRAKRTASRTGGRKRPLPKRPTPAPAAVAEPAAPAEEPDAPAFGGQLEPDREKNLENFLEATGEIEAIPDLGGDAA